MQRQWGELENSNKLGEEKLEVQDRSFLTSPPFYFQDVSRLKATVSHTSIVTPAFYWLTFT